MKKLALTVFITLLAVVSLQADQSYEDGKNVSNDVYEYLSKSGQSVVIRADQSAEIGVMIKNSVGVSEHPNLRSKSGIDPVTTYAITYQYTVDGWTQQVAVYTDGVICTNIEGPRKGAQFIIANNGALMDMRNDYKQHKNNFTHKYSWGEVNTYENYQIVKFK